MLGSQTNLEIEDDLSYILKESRNGFIILDRVRRLLWLGSLGKELLQLHLRNLELAEVNSVPGTVKEIKSYRITSVRQFISTTPPGGVSNCSSKEVIREWRFSALLLNPVAPCRDDCDC